MPESKCISVPIEKLVVVTENHGGYTAGRCVICGAGGWICYDKIGVPHGTKDTNSLVHEADCPVGQALVTS